MAKWSDLQPDFSKGLIPAVLQDDATGDVLMLGYMDEEAFQKTRAEERAWFYSRSKGRLWLKGETSGHFQLVREMYLDCDSDTLLLKVEPQGPACHRNTFSCFDMPESFGLKAMEAVVQDRRDSGEEKSYTNYLFREGLDKITKKFGEEAFEVAIAAKNEDRQELAEEAADLLYHLAVLLAQSGVRVQAVEDVLLSRHERKNNFKGERQTVEEY